MYLLKKYNVVSLTTTLVVIIILVLCEISRYHGASASQIVPSGDVDQELMLTREEKLAFDKFKARVYPYLFRGDLKHDLFLLRWLRAKHLNVDVAVNDMIGLRAFYYGNKVETMTEESWDDFAPDFPFHTDAFDREGSPVGYVHLREGWDFRAAMLQGKRTRLTRYLIKIVFDLMLRLRDANRQNPRVTQFIILINLDGFNLVQQGCPLCIQTLINLLNIYERFLPGFSKEIIVVNAPPAWKTFYHALRPALSQHTRDAIKLFDTNKRQWMSYIHSKIDPKQLPASFGGSRLDELM